MKEIEDLIYELEAPLRTNLAKTESRYTEDDIRRLSFNHPPQAKRDGKRVKMHYGGK